MRNPCPDGDEGDDSEDMTDLENPEIAGAPVTWFNILGDSNFSLVDFLAVEFGVEPQPM